MNQASLQTKYDAKFVLKKSITIYKLNFYPKMLIFIYGL